MADILVSCHVDDLDAVVGRLRAAGMQVTRVLPRLAVVTGKAELSHLDRLRALPGVRAVEVDRPITAARHG